MNSPRKQSVFLNKIGLFTGFKILLLTTFALCCNSKLQSSVNFLPESYQEKITAYSKKRVVRLIANADVNITLKNYEESLYLLKSAKDISSNFDDENLALDLCIEISKTVVYDHLSDNYGVGDCLEKLSEINKKLNLILEKNHFFFKSLRREYFLAITFLNKISNLAPTESVREKLCNILSSIFCLPSISITIEKDGKNIYCLEEVSSFFSIKLCSEPCHYGFMQATLDFLEDLTKVTMEIAGITTIIAVTYDICKHPREYVEKVVDFWSDVKECILPAPKKKQKKQELHVR